MELCCSTGEFYVYDEIEKKIVFKGYSGDYPDIGNKEDYFVKDSFNMGKVKIKLPRPLAHEEKDNDDDDDNLADVDDIEEEIIKEYYENTNILKAEFKQGFPGGCGAIVDYKNTYYRNSNLKSKSLLEIFFLKQNKDGCHSLWTLEKYTEYYKNGKEKTSGSLKYGYESIECPCGIWKYYDDKGALKETKKFGNCYDENFDCE